MSDERTEIILIIITGTIILSVLAFFIVLFIAYYRRKSIKQKKERELIAQLYQQELLRSQLEIQEQTLKNISQEIHDNIGQALSLAKLTLNTMLPVEDERLKQKIINSKDLVSKSIADLRDLSRSLDTDYVKEMGLQRAIEYELEIMHKTETIATKLIVEGNRIRLEKQKELILFRIIQETLNNTIKHAEATELTINIYYRTSEMELQISDNGKGVDLTPLNEGNKNNFGLGIRNMHNRARLIGATFNMDSTLGKGTCVQIILPTENNNYENPAKD